MMTRMAGRVLVTGGGSFLGDHIAAALLAERVPVSLLVRPGMERELGALRHLARWSSADVWQPGSLRGQARGHAAVIHTVGSGSQDPARGLSYERLNLISARNVVNMCISDGVQRLFLISPVYAPWLSRSYLKSKRDAERYVLRAGLDASVIRAPLLYRRGEPRPIFFRGLSLLSQLPPIRWLPLGRVGAMPIDIFARGVARLALSDTPGKRLAHPRELRRLGSGQSETAVEWLSETQRITASGAGEDDLRFGWTPGDER